MELLNFTIENLIELEWPDGGYADLHNNFSFSQLTYEPQVARLTLQWKKSAGEWAERVEIASLSLVFTAVNYLRIKERDPTYPLSEDECLSEIGWWPPDERDNFDSYYLNQDAQFTYDLIIRFQSEWAVKVNASTAQLVVEML